MADVIETRKAELSFSLECDNCTLSVSHDTGEPVYLWRQTGGKAGKGEVVASIPIGKLASILEAMMKIVDKARNEATK